MKQIWALSLKCAVCKFTHGILTNTQKLNIGDKVNVTCICCINSPMMVIGVRKSMSKTLF